MNDSKFKLLESIKDELTIEDVLRLHDQGIVTHCEDGRVVGFDFEYYPLDVTTNVWRVNNLAI